MVLHDLVGNRSVPSYTSPYHGTTNLNVDNNPHYNDSLKLTRDYRLRTSLEHDEITPNDVEPDVRNSKSEGPGDEYVSKAHRFVKRNKEVIESGAMFQMQPLPKSKMRLKISLYNICFVKSWKLFYIIHLFYYSVFVGIYVKCLRWYVMVKILGR